MKKRFAKLTAWLLVFSMLLPLTSYAAAAYDIYVSISDVGGGAQATGTTIEETVRYVSSSFKMADVLAEVVLRHYVDGDNSTEMYRFASPEMKRRMDQGLAIVANGGDGWTQYAEYAFSCPYEAGLHDKLANYNTTVAQVGAGTHIVTHYDEKADDARYGVTYTVTIIITERGTGGGKKPQGDPTIIIEEETGGTTTVSDDHADPGDKVIVHTDPAEKHITGYVTVRDDGGKKLPLTYEGKGDYGFTMPEGEVTVHVSYRPEPMDPAVSGVARLLDPQEHIAFMQGFKSGEFRPGASITRAQVAAIFYRLLRDQNVEITKTFTDVPESYWAATSIGVLASLGILKGMTKSDFAPNSKITRAQFAAICARFAYAVTTGDKVSFTDVPTEHWAYDEIETAVQYGWLYGYDDGSFAPNAPITRAQAAAIMDRMLARLGDQIYIDQGGGRDYTDVNDDYWAWYDIQEASTDHDHEKEENFYHEFWDDSQTRKLES